MRRFQLPDLPYLLILVTLILLSGCITVESYQKIYLNDRDMELQPTKVQVFELDFQSYREGASGGASGKTGGGCGCN
jgi:hypothetical protein